MGLVLGAIAGAAIALRALWLKLTRDNPARSLAMARQIKLGTNLLTVTSQAVGYAAELLSGTRTSLPGTSSTTTQVVAGTVIPSADTFNSRTAASVAA